MFGMCLTTIKIAINAPKTVNVVFCLAATANTGSESAAIIDARDIIRQIKKTIAKRASAIAVGIGNRPKKTPADVATPLPPLKLRKIVHMCPAMAQTATAIRTPALSLKKWRATSTGAMPLAKSSANASLPSAAPQVRVTFVAPGLPEPCWRRSIPLQILAMIQLNGIDPIKYEPIKKKIYFIRPGNRCNITGNN